MKNYSSIEYSFYPLSEIKNFELIKGYVNLDTNEEKICCVELDIKDKSYIDIAKKISDADGEYYERSWIVEVCVDINSNIISKHELYYIDDGRVAVGIIEDNNATNAKFLEAVDIFLKSK